MVLADIWYTNSLFFRRLGWRQYIAYVFTAPGTLVSLKVCDKTVWVRKGAPDWQVALSCFSGEFDNMQYLFPKDYSGIIIDAGGFIGTAAIALSDMYPNAKVITIEPSSDNLAVLQQNIEAHPNINAIHGALVGTDINTISLRNRNTGEVGFSVVESPLDQPNAETVQDVPAYRLSTLGVDLEEVGMIKIDIEGGEHEVLTHDKDHLQQVPAVMIELHDRIVPGCSDAFFEFAKERIIIKDGGEKYLSIRKDI